MQTDRQTVEIIVLLALVRGIVIKSFDEDEADEEHKHHIDTLQQAIEEAAYFPEPKRSKLLRRAQRTTIIIDRWLETQEATVGKAGLILFYMLQDLVDSQYIIIGDDSPVLSALDWMAPFLGAVAENQRVADSARKRSGQLLSKLQENNVFV